MNELENYISNIEKDEIYHVVEVFKDSVHSRTERVLAQDGTTYIRKYFSLNIPGGENECRLLAGLRHPALPQVHDYYELSGKGVLIEEYIDGIKLSDIIRISGALPEPRAIELTKELCKVCIYLHRQPSPVIHRDIKPDNIICMADGSIKLIDFGAAREYKDDSSKDTVYVGTIGFAPPEQFGFGQTDMRADVYGIGMTLLNMLTGKSPERGQTIRLSGTHISVDIQRIIQNATQFDPAKRYKSVSYLLSELDTLVPKKNTLLSMKESVLKKANTIFPKHRNWPAFVKWLFMPLHIMLAITFAAVVLRDIFQPTGYGISDDILRFSTDFGTFAFILLPSYILGFNLFNLNEKIPFFRKRRLLKKILLILVLFFVGGFLLSVLGDMHSQAYKLTQI